MRALSILLLFFYATTAAQVNLVINGGFEEYSKCPYMSDQISLAKGWSSIDTVLVGLDSIGKSSCNAEYCNECGSSPYSKIPDNFGFYHYARTGKGAVSAFMFIVEPSPKFYPYYRDYIQGRLTKPLLKGKLYCVNFHVLLEEGSGYAVKNIGAYFDNGAIDTSVTSCLPQTRYTPQVVNNGGIISDKVNWTKIEGSFVANGTESFITIGNFKDGANTTCLKLINDSINSYVIANNGQSISYYLIDDVSVIESDLPAFAGNNRHIGLGDSTYIGRPQEVGLEYTWAKLGSSTVIGTGGGIWVKPNSTTSYVVTQMLCGNIKRDTVLVEVWPLGLSSVKGQTQEYSVVPNPSHGLVNFLQNVANEEQLQVAVYNLVGQEQYLGSLHFKDGKAQIDLSALSNGLYYLRLQNKAGAVWNKKWLKE
ncbi:MAG: T9SS type A sorting domain-containing protein [Bacteroidetes bacterium]|nr:T9SS type A sorting domain-containing protein [Bacteroidota bacterium]